MTHVRIVGFDPSLANWGCAHLLFDTNTGLLSPDLATPMELIKTENEAGKKVRKNSDDLVRASLLQSGMQRHCRGMAIACAEVPHGSQSARAMASYGICIGVLSACPIPLIELKEAEVKLESGYKHATKEEMIQWASALYPHLNWLKHGGKLTQANEHLADAIGAIHAGVRTPAFRAAIAMMSSISR
jgi:hypothetical protein